MAVIGLKEAMTWENRYLKIVWGLLIVLGLIATGYYAYKNSAEYLDNKILTKVGLERRDEYEYPPFVLCPPAFFSYEQAKAMGLSRNVLIYAMGYGSLWNTYVDLGPRGIPRTSVQQVLEGSPENETLLYKIAHEGKMEFISFYQEKNFTSVRDFFELIAFNASSQHMGFIESDPAFMHYCYDCDEDHPMNGRKLIYDNAICYSFTFNSATENASLRDTRLELVYRDLTDGIADPSRNHWLLGLYSIDDMPSIILSPNSVYTAKLNAQRMIKLADGRTCVDTSQKENSGYNQRSCVRNCTDSRTQAVNRKHSSFLIPRGPEEMLNSYDMHLRVLNGFAEAVRKVGTDRILADDPEAYRIIQEALGDTSYDGATNSLKNLSADQTIDCYKKCNPVCDRITYDLSINYNGENGNPEKNQNRSMLHLNVKHSAASQGGMVTWEEFPAMTFSDFVSNIGGTIGLFLGCTVMTVAQLIMWAIKCLLTKKLP